MADWGPLPDDPAELSARCRAVLAEAPARGRSVPADEVDEVRIASAWIAEHRPAELSLAEARDPDRLARFVGAARAG
ncbi:MAG: hypothetical protein WKF40_01420 [Thermoleophilaceae bacterium]